MSHHTKASASNPTGAVEVVRVSSAQSTSAPVDNGSTSAPVSTVSSTAPATTGATGAGSSGTPGANLPVDGIQQASNTIQGARADLTRTTGAERRLDGFDGVGGGGGGGGNGNVGQQNADNATGAPAQDTADLVTNADGIGGERSSGEQILGNTPPETQSRPTEV